MAQRLNRDAFRRWAEGQTGRYERIGGEPIAMSPEHIPHVRIKSRIWAALDRAITSGGLDCEALGDGVTIAIDEDTDYEPDAVVNCGPRAADDSITADNPVIVVEVLAPSSQTIHATEAGDSTDKLADYFRVPSIQHCLIVRQRRREVVHHRRSGDVIVSNVINLGPICLDPPGIVIELADIYPPA